MKILLATNNQGKVERFKNLLNQVDPTIEPLTPQEANIEISDIEENGKTLAENAELKAQDYFGKINIPILANDTGVYVEGEGFINSPKRIALGDDGESLTKQEITQRLLSFWKNIATKYGGKVDAAWIEAFVVVYPDGSVKSANSKREVVLTDQEFGKAHPQMPVRALYYSKTTNKPAILHTKSEELLEMQPVIQALISVLT